MIALEQVIISGVKVTFEYHVIPNIILGFIQWKSVVVIIYIFFLLLVISHHSSRAELNSKRWALWPRPFDVKTWFFLCRGGGHSIFVSVNIYIGRCKIGCNGGVAGLNRCWFFLEDRNGGCHAQINWTVKKIELHPVVLLCIVQRF